MKFWQNHQKQLGTRFKLSSVKGFVSLSLVAAFLSIAIAACSGGGGNSSENPATPGASPASANNKDVEVTLVSFAVTKAAHEAIIPKFIAKWKQEHNQNVTFKQSYGGSGSQTRAVIDGLPADVVHLALGNDINKLAKAKLVSSDWDQKLLFDCVFAAI